MLLTPGNSIRNINGVLQQDPAHIALVKAHRAEDGTVTLKTPYHPQNREWIQKAFKGALDWDGDAWSGVADVELFFRAMRHLRWVYNGLTYVRADGEISDAAKKFVQTWTRIDTNEWTVR